MAKSRPGETNGCGGQRPALVARSLSIVSLVGPGTVSAHSRDGGPRCGEGPFETVQAIVERLRDLERSSQSWGAYLAVSSDGPVEVCLDGGAAHATPVLLKGVSAGRHVLHFSGAGYRRRFLEIDIKQGETRRIHISTEPRVDRPRAGGRASSSGTPR
jgi:hypothetical protein